MDTTESQSAEPETKRLPIRTYHCRFCSHLLIASTRELLSATTPLRRRRRQQQGSEIEGKEEAGGVGGLDGALILELPSSSTSSHSSSSASSAGIIEERGEVAPDNSTAVSETTKTTAPAAIATAAAGKEHDIKERQIEQAHYTIPLSTLVPDPAPIIIRREDGFEKRVLMRCGRCRVVVGYKLVGQEDKTGFVGGDDDLDEDDDDGLTSQGKGREKAIYLLPGSIVGTEDLDVGLTEDETGRGGDALNAMIERNPVLKGMEAEWMEWVK